MEEEEESGSNLTKIIFIAAVVIISGLLIWFVGGMLSKPIEPPKKTVQEIKIIRPPPPPPEVEEEPPPEPEVEEEIIPEEPEPLPDDSALEPPAGDQLGLDAEGGAGGDAFGLLGKKGGRSLLSGSGTSRFNWYANIIKTELLENLYEEEKLRSKGYRIRCNIWVSKSGDITKVKVLNSTGDNEIDALIKNALNSMTKISDVPPEDMPMPIKLAIESR